VLRDNVYRVRADVRITALKLLDRQRILQSAQRNIQARASDPQQVSAYHIMSSGLEEPQAHDVPRDLFNDKYTGKTTGGFVVYYVSGGKGQVTAFKPGFRMLVGDVGNRKSQNKKSQTCFRCYNAANFGGDNAAPCQDATYVTP
jgi:hypothetical protein